MCYMGQTTDTASFASLFWCLVSTIGEHKKGIQSQKNIYKLKCNKET